MKYEVLRKLSNIVNFVILIKSSKQMNLLVKFFQPQYNIGRKAFTLHLIIKIVNQNI